MICSVLLLGVQVRWKNARANVEFMPGSYAKKRRAGGMRFWDRHDSGRDRMILAGRASIRGLAYKCRQTT